LSVLVKIQSPRLHFPVSFLCINWSKFTKIIHKSCTLKQHDWSYWFVCKSKDCFCIVTTLTGQKYFLTKIFPYIFHIKPLSFITFSWSHSFSDFHEIFSIKCRNKYLGEEILLTRECSHYTKAILGFADIGSMEIVVRFFLYHPSYT
jgi:hypothetical protein